MTLRGALLGCGHVSIYHLRAWAQIEGVEIVALANRTIDKAEARAREFGISMKHIYSDYRELFDKEAIDFVDIASAPHIHRVQVEAAAAYGRHILCQKPFAPNLEDAQAMIDACNRAGVLFSINENWRWRSWYREVKRLLDQGVIGQPRYARIARHTNLVLPIAAETPALFINQSYLLETDMLILYEWGTHLIDVLRFFFGDPMSLYARMDKVSPFGQGEDRALVVLNFETMIGLIDISWSTINSEAGSSQLEQVTIEGDNGTIKLMPESGDLLEVTSRDESWQRPAFNITPAQAYQESYTATQRHFIECLREGRTPETVASDNLKTLQATLAAYQSAQENQVIQLEGF